MLTDPDLVQTATPVAQPARPARRLPRTNPFKVLFQLLIIAVLAYGSFFLVTHFVLQSIQVVGNSMAPTLQNAQHYILNRWVYLLREPRPSDIVVLRDPTDNSFAVKRIIAREGDSVYLKNGRIYVNGKALEEPYLPPGTRTYANPTAREQWVVCGKSQYFVLGDNRNNSSDSRNYGPVSRQDILGLIIH